MRLIEYIRQPWPWFVAGLLIGLSVPALLIMGNKRLGVSSSLRHICAACFPAGISFFKYDWKRELWNLFFVAGIFIGGMISATLLANPYPIQLNPKLITDLQQYHIGGFSLLEPTGIFSWQALLTLKGLIFTIVGGFLVGFGTRYAGGCTSGHAIMGLSSWQWPSLVATACFMAGGFIMANVFLPFILRL
ncbi:MAG: YeeE/YedE family protein [Bacteroidetes bacterium]|nr:YeeE/YedE family protein [Bacteroidota bacterium]MBS1973050.1 YeeE/YedE family protein [Bacteroidota bacterium]